VKPVEGDRKTKLQEMGVEGSLLAWGPVLLLDVWPFERYEDDISTQNGFFR